MNIAIRTDNCDQERIFLIEDAADSEIELKLEFDEIVSVQSRNDRKKELRSVILDTLSRFKWIVTGSVNVELLWYLNATQRQETDKVGDIDNITKPILDSLTGSQGVLIDDSQIGSLHTFWQSRNAMTSFNVLHIWIRFNNDYSLFKNNLIFVQYAGAVCIPLNVDFADHSAMLIAFVLIRARRKQRAAAESIRVLGENADRMLLVSNWEVHRTRLGGFDKASIMSLVEFREKCKQRGLTWKMLRSMWRPRRRRA